MHSLKERISANALDCACLEVLREDKQGQYRVAMASAEQAAGLLQTILGDPSGVAEDLDP
jgi:hypothetical protein